MLVDAMERKFDVTDRGVSTTRALGLRLLLADQRWLWVGLINSFGGLLTIGLRCEALTIVSS